MLIHVPRGQIWQRQNLDEAISRAPVGQGVEEFLHQAALESVLRAGRDRMASLACSAGRNASLTDACGRPALAVALGGRGRQARGRGAGALMMLVGGMLVGPAAPIPHAPRGPRALVPACTGSGKLRRPLRCAPRSSVPDVRWPRRVHPLRSCATSARPPVGTRAPRLRP